MWTVQEAKSKLSEVLDRARKGEAQVVGARDPCVIISMAEYERLRGRDDEEHLGRWLVDNLGGLGEIELPARAETRQSPFVGWSEKDFPE
jgi:prevent-host-death family protein